MMLNRGPQFVQFRKGYPNLLSWAEKSSERQSGQVAISGEIIAERSVSRELSRMENPSYLERGIPSHTEIPSIWAKGGANRGRSFTS
jgi:hypothetical protein